MGLQVIVPDMLLEMCCDWSLGHLRIGTKSSPGTHSICLPSSSFSDLVFFINVVLPTFMNETVPYMNAMVSFHRHSSC